MAKQTASSVSSKKNKQKEKPKRRGGSTSTASTSGSHWNSKKKEIVFDAEARRAYLRGFSERKRQRRAYGLAMQKVKDRKAKLEERKEARKEDLKRVEEAEQQKEAYRNEMTIADNKKKRNSKESMVQDEERDENLLDDSSEHEKRPTEEVIENKTYEGTATEAQWGGRVIVTTSVINLDEEEEDVEVQERIGTSTTSQNNHGERQVAAKKSVDKQQQYAGNVEKFISKLKGNMPGKKKSKDLTGHHAKRKGKNGAAEMRGIGGAANLKLAQKVLHKATQKVKQGPVKKGKGGQKSIGGKKKSRR